MPGSEPGKQRITPWWETIAILLSMVALWPRVILNWPEPIWEYLLYVVLAVMIFIAILRIRRIHSLRKQRKNGF